MIGKQNAWGFFFKIFQVIFLIFLYTEKLKISNHYTINLFLPYHQCVYEVTGEIWVARVTFPFCIGSERIGWQNYSFTLLTFNSTENDNDKISFILLDYYCITFQMFQVQLDLDTWYSDIEGRHLSVASVCDWCWSAEDSWSNCDRVCPPWRCWWRRTGTACCPCPCKHIWCSGHRIGSAELLSGRYPGICIMYYVLYLMDPYLELRPVDHDGHGGVGHQVIDEGHVLRCDVCQSAVIPDEHCQISVAKVCNILLIWPLYTLLAMVTSQPNQPLPCSRIVILDCYVIIRITFVFTFNRRHLRAKMCLMGSEASSSDPEARHVVRYLHSCLWTEDCWHVSLHTGHQQWVHVRPRDDLRQTRHVSSCCPGL